MDADRQTALRDWLLSACESLGDGDALIGRNRLAGLIGCDERTIRRKLTGARPISTRDERAIRDAVREVSDFSE